MRLTRRQFISSAAVAGFVFLGGIRVKGESKHYVMMIDVDKCIGCGKCVIACKTENEIPMDRKISRTWIEGYNIKVRFPYPESEVEKVVLNTDENPFQDFEWDGDKTYFIPKLCNHCQNAPCVQVCPVFARFYTEEGIVLVDKNACIGCKYCVTACPYGATYIHPEQKVTDKCTYCYHRLRRGLKPACVTACPTKARIFGDINDPNSEVSRILRTEKIYLLKPEIGTEPQTFYLNLGDKTFVE
jgi:Fe-S-cluster-containing dehydrogenase component